MDSEFMETSQLKIGADDTSHNNSNTSSPLQKPNAVVIHKDDRRKPSSGGGDGIPLSHLRKRSTENVETGKHSAPSSVPQSPTSPVVSSTGSAVKRASVSTGNAEKKESKIQSWLPGTGSLSPDTELMNSIDLDVERGTKLEDVRAVRAKSNPRRYSAKSHVRKLSDGTRHSQISERSGDGDDEWNEAHPCFTHPNPHVPAGSPEAITTKVIRIPREYMMNGDISPAYSIVYPEILRQYLSEDQFRMIIDRINEELKIAFDPWNRWNIVDVFLGLFTFWLAEEIYPTFIKRRLMRVEEFIEEQNKTLNTGAKVIPLRRTGYINLDIQIPDPFLGPPTGDEDEVSESTAADNRDQQMKDMGPSGPLSPGLLSDAGTVPALQVNGDSSPYVSHRK